MKIVIKNNNYTKGEVIKIIREWSHQTQREFAKTINKSASSLQKYELDEVNYSFQTLMDIAKKNDLIITIEKK